MAHERIANISPIGASDLLATAPKRAKPKVPFGALIERGILRPGERLFDARRRFSARVRVDGSLVTAKQESGSIHTLGAKLLSLPSCNGWTFWHVERDGIDVLIDSFREDLRKSGGLRDK